LASERLAPWLRAYALVRGHYEEKKKKKKRLRKNMLLEKESRKDSENPETWGLMGVGRG